ncbi:cation:proton antiporter [Gemmatimonas phototrophica]|uniref:Sodium:proton antiporter n=1 Tax=Gemmatimonas phototrophica TaxID=1379270 RepID=A0A143BH30_9BACT|nr:sodium:proton antiporter [Gemmatimonas phototrophica]AMW03760.1 sodium:proton antiporter [Gemmatimonas phototrophica]
MTPFDLLAVLMTVTALFAYANYRWLRLPTTIGLLAIALVGSVVLVLLGRAEVVDLAPLLAFVNAVDFDATLLNGILGAMLFAGALHVDLNDLRAERVLIGVLATVGVIVSTLLVGYGAFFLTRSVGAPVPLAWCLVFGALISPTDPIAVGALLKTAGVPQKLQTTITGESLFNDGIGVVVFLVLAGVASQGGGIDWLHVAELFGVEVIGGVLYGYAIGWLAVRMLSRVDDYQVEILLTLALTSGGYVLANRLHLSGALAMVVAGLMIGSRGRAVAMSQNTQARLDDFWELVDEFLNAMLFVVIGIEVVIVDFTPTAALLGALAIPLVLLARWLSVGMPLIAMRRRVPAPAGALPILTWSGLRGGISVALALSLPVSEHRSILVTITYVVVCFSILVQGLTVPIVVKRVLANAPAK